MEIKASQAERDSVKFKQVQFMQSKVGGIFSGIISGVTEWGIFVEISENKCEGMIRLRDLKDDFYVFDETIKEDILKSKIPSRGATIPITKPIKKLSFFQNIIFSSFFLIVILIYNS